MDRVVGSLNPPDKRAKRLGNLGIEEKKLWCCKRSGPEEKEGSGAQLRIKTS